MPVVVEKVERWFNFKGRKFTDPDPSMTTDQVLAHYATTEPAFTKATVKGPTVKGNLHLYEIITQGGVNG